jgi:sulfur-oxidizing protein SoxX
MKARFPDKAVLRAQIEDPRTKNPDSVMPPFKPHGILTDKEIGLVTDFVYGL